MKKMINLYVETVEFLKKYGKYSTDILWAGTRDNFIDLNLFWEIANKTNYDKGYGGQEIAANLILVGRDFWLERAEYDGSEWWEFKEFPQRPDSQIPITTLSNGCWSKLEDMQDDDIYNRHGMR